MQASHLPEGGCRLGTRARQEVHADFPVALTFPPQIKRTCVFSTQSREPHAGRAIRTNAIADPRTPG
ncbi:protein of unknown function [Methylocella tundrae]|uniref:Uncharacterized protein n=1 Tax=Methylocella tundrae TaxID=227605 RepID=A0A4U8Z498_METTU|nr:protein of unknown function [Methylocella tundrae]